MLPITVEIKAFLRGGNPGISRLKEVFSNIKATLYGDGDWPKTCEEEFQDLPKRAQDILRSRGWKFNYVDVEELNDALNSA